MQSFSMDQGTYSEPISIHTLQTEAGVTLIANKEFSSLMEQSGITTFDVVWSFTEGEMVKKIRERAVLKSPFPWQTIQWKNNGLEGTPVTCFIKKHVQRLSVFKRLLALLLPGSLITEGTKEFHFYCQFRKKGLATPVPIAAGMRFCSFLEVESFLITRDFSPFIELEELVLNKPEVFEGNSNQPKKNRVLSSIAAYARKMHQAGLNQKDFNANHVLLHEIDSEYPQVALFDLQRVDTNPLNSYRWPIKALAELFYTLPQSLFSEDDKHFFFKKYKNKQELGLLDSLQYHLIKRKTARIAKHSKKHGLAPKMPADNP